ncbi:MAG TPA: sugar transferase [Micromonosporaceae bacterium]|jgi:lipopolysaccharide/colanic/teichoic acid biosynthesis glycosyltransferase
MDSSDAGTWPGIRPSRTRRALDVAVSLTALAVIGVPLLLLFAAVRCESRGPALFRQIRVGQGGRRFMLLKLRSMRTDASGSELTARGDQRITRLGRLLRATSLDELPQLVNVLRGDMTLVGPRPETPALALDYPPECSWVFAYRPGLTGPAQVRLRDREVLGDDGADQVYSYLHVIVPARTRIEARYLIRPSLPATIAVLMDTARHVLGRPVTGRA